MTFDDFLRLKRNILLGYYLLTKWHPDKFDIEVPYPPSEISEEDLEVLKDRLTDCMLLNSIIIDLWDWDAHFEKELSDDWFFEAVFGDKSSIEACAEELADYFHEQVDQFDMDYNQHEDKDLFRDIIFQEAIEFIKNWRDQIFRKFAQEKN